MLTKCVECELQVSDKALACPHCGYPMRSNGKRKYNKSNKRRRLPNGFGQISEIKGQNLREPFRVLVTVGKTSTGRPICTTLKPKAFFPTYNEAYEALVEYNKNPYDLSPSITIKELYDKWSTEYFKTLKGETGSRNIKSAWAYCSTIYNMRACDLRVRHIKGCMDEGFVVIKGVERQASPNTKSRIKSLFNLMLDYAVEYEIVDRNYARTFNISDEIVDEISKVRRGHLSFTDEEMSILWSSVNEIKYVDVLLIQCYSGWRPQELGLIRLENVDIENQTFVGGMKTDAGENRMVPIHSKILPLVLKKYNEAVDLGSEYLLNCTDGQTHRRNVMLTYDKYRHRFDKIVDRLNLNQMHRPHDGRKQFSTMAKKCKVDEYAIKYIMGHAISDITEKVYTDRSMAWLKEEIEKIK